MSKPIFLTQQFSGVVLITISVIIIIILAAVAVTTASVVLMPFESYDISSISLLGAKLMCSILALFSTK